MIVGIDVSAAFADPGWMAGGVPARAILTG